MADQADAGIEPDDDGHDRDARTTAMFQERLDILRRRSEVEERLKLAQGVGGADAPLHPDEQLDRALDDVTWRIVETHRGLIRFYVGKFAPHTEPEHIEDFEAAAELGVIEAIQTYDPERGHFGQWARNRILDQLLKAVWAADHPNLSHTDFKARSKILRAEADLVASTGHARRQPTFEQIAAKAGTSVEQVTRVLDAPWLVSLSAPSGGDREGDLGDRIADTSANVDERMTADIPLDVRQRMDMTALDARELYVIHRRLGLDDAEPESLATIAATLDLSRETVRQAELTAMAKLQRP